MKTPTIILIGTVAIIIALVLGYVVFVKPKSGEQVQAPKVNNNMADIMPTPNLAPDNTSTTPTPAPNDTSEIDTSDWKTYRNEEHGFEIAFPPSWKGFIVETKELELVEAGKYNSINFGFSIQNSLFNINIFTKDQWEKLIFSEVSSGRPEPNYINKNDRFFFNIAAAQYTENQEMVDRMSEIGDIISTFKFIK